MLSLTIPSKRQTKTPADSRSNGKRQKITKFPKFIFNTIFRKQSKPAPPTDNMNIFGGYVEHTLPYINTTASKFTKFNVSTSQISTISIDSDETELLPLTDVMDEDVPIGLRVSAHVELPVDVWMLIVEEITNPTVLANLARTSRLLWALSTPQLYKAIGIGLYEHGIGVFPVRPKANRTCTGHGENTTDVNTNEYRQPLATEAVLRGLSRRNGNGQYVKSLHFKDLRLSTNPLSEMYKLLPSTIMTMKNLECFKWISDLQPKAGGRTINLPKHLPQVIMGLHHYAPDVREWHIECSQYLSSYRDVHRQSMVWFLDGLRILDIQNCKDIITLQRVSNYLHSEAGRNVEELIVGPTNTLQVNARKIALSTTFNCFRNGTEPRKLTFRKIDLRNYIYQANVPNCLDLVDRDSLRELRISGNVGKQGNPEHFLNAEFTHPETGIPRNLHTLHIGCGYPGLAGPFFRSCPPLQEFVVNIDAKKELVLNSPICTFILTTGPTLRRLAIHFLASEGEVQTAAENILAPFTVEEEAFLESIAQACSLISELTVCTSRNYLKQDFSRPAYLMSLFPSLNSLAIGSRGDRNEWSEAITDGGPRPSHCLAWAKTAMDTYYHIHRRLPKLFKINDHVYRILPSSYIFREGDCRAQQVSYSQHCGFVEVTRWDLHEAEVPGMFRIMEGEGEMDKWSMGCSDEMDCF